MIPLLGLAAVCGAITFCLVPLCYCKKSVKNHVLDKNERVESPVVHIRISHPHQDKLSNDICNPDGKLPSCRRRTSTKIWSTPLRKKLKHITDSSAEMCCGTKTVVQAQIEPNPMLNNNEDSESFRCKSLRNDHDSPGQASNQQKLNDERTKKTSSAFGKKWKKLKILFRIRSKKSVPFKDFEIDKIQRLNVPISTSGHRSPSKHAAQLNRCDVSTSTMISRNQNNEIVENCNDSDKTIEIPSKEEIDQRYSNAKAIQEAVSLTNRSSVDGKSVCDLRITGLTMNQSQLLDLFEATGGQTRTASIVTTEEASIISIKFYHRRNSNEATDATDSFIHEGPFGGFIWKLYKRLPERLEETPFARLFRSQDQGQSSNLAASSIRVSNNSKTSYGSRNNTSYFGFPRRETESLLIGSCPTMVGHRRGTSATVV
ncbi:uncharacterized protein LOC128891241 isoform X1 [Hylaeus anthracinus]|uniref:uncharacterized protein LOC128891241 isoform X1 n=1 Tax=Hylaeus anthracinus TaxID=313031 RepID=UPI0023BA05F8|nr:uncharacterized protein LOC128891241 isoform X1 [Hylaeus anthracinus]